MKKTYIAFAILGVAAGAAHAQSSLTIYGSADISYVKERGSSVSMIGGGANNYNADNTYLGVKGTEDLGGGLKATFQLEQRFDLANGQGSADSSMITRNAKSKFNNLGSFEGASNVGLTGNFGQFRFGRVNELSTETYRRIDPFDQNGVAGVMTTPFRGDNGTGRVSYTARYDSPTINGINLGASYTVKNGLSYYGPPGYYENNGYAVSATYSNGPMYMVANYNKAVNSESSYNWNVGGAYAFGPLKLSLGYENSRDKRMADAEYKTWLAGASYRYGRGTFKASYGRIDAESYYFEQEFKQTQYAFGYTHDLSKRTSVYANYAHGSVQQSGVGMDRSQSFNAVEVGITHKF